MINKFEIKNFKSIENLDIELGQINLFLGANGCGKTNILEAVGVVSSAVYGIVDDESLLRRGVRPGVPRLYKTSNKYRPRQPHISFTAIGYDCEYHVSLLNPMEKPKPQWNYKTEKFVGKDGVDLYARGVKSNKNPTIGGIPAFLGQFEIGSCEEKFYTSLKEYAIYNPNTPALRGMIPDAQNRLPVGLSGGGLPDGLINLLAEQDTQIEEAIKEVISLFQWVKSVNGEINIGSIVSGSVPRPKRVITFIDRYMKENSNKITASDASEGVLYALFLMVLCLSKDGPSIFAIDNIDQALNPRLLQALVNNMQDWFIDIIPEKQIFCTAHNPAILDGIDFKNELVRIFIVDRNNYGLTVVKPLKITESLIKISKEKGISLSRMWVEGYLGGVPNV